MLEQANVMALLTDQRPSTPWTERTASWVYPTPTSYSALRAEVEGCDFSRVPRALLECPEFVPFYCLLMPHRFHSIAADLLEQLASTGQVS